MFNLVQAVKVTEEGRTENLEDLQYGDNLERDGKREIVNSCPKNHKGLYEITTMRVTMANSRVIKNIYLASEQMLKEGELRAEIPINDPADHFDEKFYQDHYVRKKPMEVTA